MACPLQGNSSLSRVSLAASQKLVCTSWHSLCPKMLRSISFPVFLHSVAADQAEHALYLGGANGRIFKVSLAGPQQAPGLAAFLALGGSARSGGVVKSQFSRVTSHVTE